MIMRSIFFLIWTPSHSKFALFPSILNDLDHPVDPLKTLRIHLSDIDARFITKIKSIVSAREMDFFFFVKVPFSQLALHRRHCFLDPYARYISICARICILQYKSMSVDLPRTNTSPDFDRFSSTCPPLMPRLNVRIRDK
eukprot:20616_1